MFFGFAIETIPWSFFACNFVLVDSLIKDPSFSKDKKSSKPLLIWQFS